MQPLISVIVPFYNMQDFLPDAVESVLAQDYPGWELLLVDDGSSDGSTALVENYRKLHPEKIICLAHGQRQNRGLTASRNLALSRAKGEYVALLDADDYWLPQKLSEQVRIAAEHPECALIGGASLYWYSWSDPLLEDRIIAVGCPADRVIHPPQLTTLLYPLGRGAAPCPCSLLIKKEALLRHKGFEDQFSGIYQMYEDQAFLAKLYLNEPCYFSSRCLDQYRQRPRSLVDEVHRSGKYIRVRKFFLEWLRHYLEENGVSDQRILKALKHALSACRNPGWHRLQRWWNKTAGRQ